MNAGKHPLEEIAAKAVQGLQRPFFFTRKRVAVSNEDNVGLGEKAPFPGGGCHGETASRTAARRA